MPTIWKFPIAIKDHQQLLLPRGATPLSVQLQGTQICIWALVDPVLPQEDKRMVYIFGTGHPVPEHLKPSNFLGTVQTGIFVWHVFIDLL